MITGFSNGSTTFGAPSSNSSPTQVSANALPTTAPIPKKGELTKAAATGDTERVRALIEAHADVNEDMGNGTDHITPLIAAVSGKHTAAAALLITAHADAKL